MRAFIRFGCPDTGAAEQYEHRRAEQQEKSAPKAADKRQPVKTPAVQYGMNVERERKIAEKIRRRKRRPVIVILTLCALLVVAALIVNAMQKDRIPLTRDEIYNELSSTLNDVSIDFEQLSKNFNELISTLNINMSELSRFSSYDASFLSRIRTGNGNPSHPKDFATAVCNFIIKKYTSDDNKKEVAILINSTL